MSHEGNTKLLELIKDRLEEELGREPTDSEIWQEYYRRSNQYDRKRTQGKNNKPPSDKYVKYTYDKATKITEVEFRQAPPVKEEDRGDDSRNQRHQTSSQLYKRN